MKSRFIAGKRRLMREMRKFSSQEIRNILYPVSRNNRSRESELKQITRGGNLSKLTKASAIRARTAFGVRNRGWIAIAQFRKRGDSSLRTKDVIIPPLFSTAPPSPSTPSLRRRPPRDVSPTLARNPLFARQTRIVCSQESAVVQVEGPILFLSFSHALSLGKGRNFNYGNITRDRI